MTFRRVAFAPTTWERARQSVLTPRVPRRTVVSVNPRQSSSGKGTRSVAVLGVAVSLLVTQACTSIDTTRQAPRATLGDDLYSVMCDRLGATVFSEDLDGASFHRVCHIGASGAYADTVDAGVLPVFPGAKAARARELGVAKLEAMARHRTELIRAFNGAFPSTNIPDRSAGDPNATLPLHTALLGFTQALTTLYDGNPYEPGGRPLMPAATEALGGVLGDLEQNDAARAALGRASGRRGYRPEAVGFGALATLLTYPKLAAFTRAALAVLAPAAKGAPALQSLLTAGQAELATTTCTLCNEPPILVSADVTLNRPRATSELLQRIFLDEADAYAESTEEPRFLVRRDRRGVAVPKGNIEGYVGTVPAPFSDVNSDGYADVDDRSRFTDEQGQPLAIDAPFAISGESHGPVDSAGRPTSELYDYLDVSRTFLASVTRDLAALLDPTTYAGGAPDAWKTEHEALMYALGAIPVLAGERAPAQYDHEAGKELAAAASCPSKTVPCTAYSRFVSEGSPLPDLVHALGQVLADPESDAVLVALETLVRDHEDVVARLLDAGLRVKAIADAHDELAANGEEPKAELPYATPIWDQVAAIVGSISERPGLVVAVTKALANDVIVTAAPQNSKIPESAAQHLGETVSAFATMLDQYRYNPADLNGVALNLTDGATSIANPHNPVDRTQPLTGDNRSMLERALQLIHGSSGVKACNKPGAKLHTKVVDWPLGDSYGECELFVFPNIGAFYLDALLPLSHPKRAELGVVAPDVTALMNFVGNGPSLDKLLEASSGIAGMTLHPSPVALNRLLFFGANSDAFGKLPDYDAKNAGSDTMQFISLAIDPVASRLCPKNGLGVPTCKASNSADLLRVRDFGTIFGWERLGFQSYLAPVVQAFATVACNPAVTTCDTTNYVGERLFMDLLGVLWRHWPSMAHGDYCDHTVASSDAAYCSGAGVNRYEPIIAEAALTDVVPALHAFAKVASTVQITVERGPKAGTTLSGGAVLERLARILFSQEYAADVGMVARSGKATTTWVDGTPQARVTVFSMLADALHGMDERFAKSSLPDAGARLAKWRRGRSLLVDQFLAVEGSGSSARFVNRAVPAALLATLRAVREQTNAHCPKRESTGSCEWASRELSTNVASMLAGPVFAGAVDAADALNQDESARRELERLAQFALLGENDPRARDGLLASLADGLQLAPSDGEWAPVLSAASAALRPKASPAGPGFADRALLVLDASTSDAVDPDRVLSFVLPLLVTPTDGGAGRAPLDVILETLADVNRYDARETTPLAADDIAFVMRTVREFLTSPYRGFAQLFAVVQNRTR